MGNCISRGFGVSDNVEKTEEMSNTKMGRGLELPDDYSTYGVTGRGYRNRCREPCDYYKNNNNNKKVEAAEVFPRYNSGGVWKVNLVISSEQLSQILSEEARTEALIESVRTAAKCTASGASSVAVAADSHQWSTFL
nr:uncharacterized protein LOC109360013 [Ipomoea batatas]